VTLQNDRAKTRCRPPSRLHPLPAHVAKPAHALMPCRTAALGGHSHACPDGHGAGVWTTPAGIGPVRPLRVAPDERWLGSSQRGGSPAISIMGSSPCPMTCLRWGLPCP